MDAPAICRFAPEHAAGSQEQHEAGKTCASPAQLASGHSGHQINFSANWIWRDGVAVVSRSPALATGRPAASNSFRLLSGGRKLGGLSALKNSPKAALSNNRPAPLRPPGNA